MKEFNWERLTEAVNRCLKEEGEIYGDEDPFTWVKKLLTDLREDVERRDPVKTIRDICFIQGENELYSERLLKALLG